MNVMNEGLGRRKAMVPTDEEEAQINAGIAADPDNPELGEDFWRKAKPASAFFSPKKFAELVALGNPNSTGAQSRKVWVTICVDAEVLEALRSSGQGWQTRANELLRKAVECGRLNAVMSHASTPVSSRGSDSCCRQHRCDPSGCMRSDLLRIAGLERSRRAW